MKGIKNENDGKKSLRKRHSVERNSAKREDTLTCKFIRVTVREKQEGKWDGQRLQYEDEAAVNGPGYSLYLGPAGAQWKMMEEIFNRACFDWDIW